MDANHYDISCSKPAGAVKFAVYGSQCGNKNKLKKLTVTTKKTFTCKIYVFTQNGISKTVRITVN